MDRQLWKFLQGLSALQVVKGHPPEAVGLPGFHKQTFVGKGVLDEELTFKEVGNVSPKRSPESLQSVIMMRLAQGNQKSLASSW